MRWNIWQWKGIRYGYILGFPGSSAGKKSACNAGDPGSIPGSGSSPGEGIGYPLQYSWASLVAQTVKNPPQETWVPSLGWEDPWRRERLPTSVFWPGEFHRQRSPAGYRSPWTWLSDFKKKKRTRITTQMDLENVKSGKRSQSQWVICLRGACMLSRSVLSNSWDPMGCSPPGSSVYGIFQARMLELVAISFSKGSSWTRDWTCVSCVSCIDRWSSLTLSPWEAL